MTRLVYANERPLALEAVSFADCDVDPDYVEDVASDLGSVPRFSKRKVSPLAFL